MLAKKRAAPELGLQSPIPSIHEFVELELARLERIDIAEDAAPEKIARLDGIFRHCLAEARA